MSFQNIVETAYLGVFLFTELSQIGLMLSSQDIQSFFMFSSQGIQSFFKGIYLFVAACFTFLLLALQIGDDGTLFSDEGFVFLLHLVHAPVEIITLILLGHM